MINKQDIKNIEKLLLKKSQQGQKQAKEMDYSHSQWAWQLETQALIIKKKEDPHKKLEN